VVQNQLPFASVGIKSKGNKILKALDKIK